MSKISKLLVMLLALVMVVSLIAGCKPTTQLGTQTGTQQGNNNNDPTGSTGNVETNPPAVDEFTSANIIWNDIFPLEEPITFKMAAKGEKDYNSLIQKCEWYKYMCEKTNVFIDVIALGSDAVGKLNTLITTGSAPDVVLGPTTLNSAQVIDLAEQGYIIPLDDYLTDPEVMPNYQRLIKAVPQALQKAKTPDGHIYSVVGVSKSEASAWESPLTVNIEWLKQVPGYESGERFPATVEEFTDVLRYFKAHDMNGNGDTTDEVPFLFLSSSSAPGDACANLQGLMNLWGIGTKDGANEYYVHISDDGQDVTIAPTTQNYRDCLKWVNVWYEEGLLWESFFSKVSNKDQAATTGNSTAMWGFFNGASWWNNGPYLDSPEFPWADAQTLVIPFDTGYDVHYFINPTATGSLNNFTIFSTCEAPEILLAWYDQWLSLEGTLNTYRRMPNEWERYDDAELYRAYYEANPTWYIDEEGMTQFPHLTQEDYVELSEYDAELNDKIKNDHPSWSAIFNSNAVFQGVTRGEYNIGAYPNHEYSEDIVLGKFIQEHPEYFDHYMWPRPYSTADEAEVLSDYWPQVSRVIQTWEVDFIKGTKSLETDWEDFQEELVDAGSEELIEALQSIWDRVKE